MKKYLASFIIILFLFNLFGYYLPYLLIRSSIKSEMKEKVKESLPDEFLVKFSFPNKDLKKIVHWEEEGKEFEYNNEMYDVVRILRMGDTTMLFCLKDKDEKSLMANFEGLVKKNLENDGRTKNLPVKELSKYNLDLKPRIFPSFKRTEFISQLTDFYTSQSLDINSPPPRV